MSRLRPCPFCGNEMQGYPDYSISFKQEKREVYGVYHQLCTLKCNRCGCTIQQAGVDKESAEQHAYALWQGETFGRKERT